MEGQYLAQVSVGKERRLKSGFQPDREEMIVILPKIFSGISNVRAGMSTRIGNESDTEFGINLSYNVGDNPTRVGRNRRKFFAQVGISEHDLAIPLQCHSNNVLKVDTPGEYRECDALITNTTHVTLVVTVADCVPILLFDPINKAVGAAHAGWRGTMGLIVTRAVEKMKAEYRTDPAQMLAYIGPSAGVCCYEVGGEVAVMFGNKVVPYEKKKIFIDLKKENTLQLLQQGVLEKNIEVSTSCTICEKELFHSYRRDGQKSGRMMAVICMMQ
jgi:YfiH family protein